MSHYLNTEVRGILQQVSDCLPTAGDRSVRCALARAARTVALWDQRHRQRRALRELTPALLADIGITEEQAMQEAAKPFWKA